MRLFRVTARLVLALLATWLCVCVALAALVIYTGTLDAAAPADAIVVLGAALSRDGTPCRALTRRAEHAAQLWTRRLAPVVICTGGIGAHVQVPRSEADGCREVLMRHGVPRAAILLEQSSRTTAENAHEARQLMHRHGWRRAIVVSDSYHVLRARYLFGRAGIQTVSSPVPAAQVGSPLFYVMSVIREVAALQWQMAG